MIVVLSSQVLTKSNPLHESVWSHQTERFQKGPSEGPAVACSVTVADQLFELPSCWEEEGCCDRDIRWKFELAS